MTAHAVLSLGANLGDRLAALQGAVDELHRRDDVRVVAVSRVYATAPVGGPEQPDYFNAIAIIDTELTGPELLDVVHGIEADWDRVREVRWGPRTLDIDIIDFDGQRSEAEALTLPHPRAAERAFVIVPWCEVEPDAVLPGHGPITDITPDTTGVVATDHRLFIQ